MLISSLSLPGVSLLTTGGFRSYEEFFFAGGFSSRNIMRSSWGSTLFLAGFSCTQKMHYCHWNGLTLQSHLVFKQCQYLSPFSHANTSHTIPGQKLLCLQLSIRNLRLLCPQVKLILVLLHRDRFFFIQHFFSSMTQLWAEYNGFLFSRARALIIGPGRAPSCQNIPRTLLWARAQACSTSSMAASHSKRLDAAGIEVRASGSWATVLTSVPPSPWWG